MSWKKPHYVRKEVPGGIYCIFVYCDNKKPSLLDALQNQFMTFFEVWTWLLIPEKI